MKGAVAGRRWALREAGVRDLAGECPPPRAHTHTHTTTTTTTTTTHTTTTTTTTTTPHHTTALCVLKQVQPPCPCSPRAGTPTCKMLMVSISPASTTCLQQGDRQAGRQAGRRGVGASACTPRPVAASAHVPPPALPARVCRAPRGHSHTHAAHRMSGCPVSCSYSASRCSACGNGGMVQGRCPAEAAASRASGPGSPCFSTRPPATDTEAGSAAWS
mgnify:CR=1 FL=1